VTKRRNLEYRRLATDSTDSSRKSPARRAFRKSRLVAAITRMFAFCGAFRPTAEIRVPGARARIRLAGRAHLADFIEKEDTAEASSTGPVWLAVAGKRAALVAEELDSELLWQGRAIDRDESPPLRADAR